eukprot:jgi/Ulvmu1/11806/UM080_0017.1
MWQPDQERLKELVFLLESTQQPGNNHREALDRLDSHKRNEDCNNYFAFLFALGHDFSEVVRHTAALVLKNNILLTARSPRGAQSPHVDAPYIRQACLAMLQSAIRPLRQAAGTLAAALLSYETLDRWPDLVRYTVEALQHPDPGIQEGTLTMVYKIAEDFPYQLQENIIFAQDASAKPTDVLMPHIAALFSTSQSDDVRYHALRTFNKLVDLLPEWLLNNMDGYVTGLLALANREKDARIHREICIGANTLMRERPAALEPHIDDFISYILAAMQHADADVAIEATTFWILYLECGLPLDRLAPRLPKVVELLLQHMVFEEHDEEVVAALEAEAGGGRGENDADLRPFHSARGGGGSGNGGAWTDTDDGSRSGQGSEEVPSEFTLRRSCAQTLDHIAVELRGALLPHVLPIVERYLADADWRLREAAILALGAIADGCAESLRARVPGILRLLLDKMADPQPNVRCNSCWAAGRYTAFRVQDAAEEGDRNAEAEVLHIVKALLERAQEHNICVHYAALSALSCVHEDLKHYQAGAMLEASAPETLHMLVALLPHYTKRNVRQAFETLIQIVRAVPVCMEDPDIIQMYMEPLVERLGLSPPLNVEVMPLLDTLIHLTLALGGNVERYALLLLKHSLTVGSANLSVADADAAASATASSAATPPSASPPQPSSSSASPLAAASSTGSPRPGENALYALSIVTYCLDLIAALLEVLKGSSDALIAAVGAEQVAQLALACARTASPYVQQSAFALIGELAAQVPAVAARCHGAEMLQLCHEMIHPDRIQEPYTNAANNACWALGLLGTALPADTVAPIIAPAAERMLGVLKGGSGSVQRRLRENAAITLGRLATVQPSALAAHLSHFLGDWCVTLALISDGSEKAFAFQGLLALLRLNLEAAGAAFTSLCAAIASWGRPPPPLEADFGRLIKSLRSSLEAVGQWEAALSRVESDTFTPRIRTKILHYSG